MEIPLWDNAYDTTRNGGISIKLDEATRVQMKSQRNKIIFESRALTKEELQDCLHIQLTSKEEWNPTKVRMSEVVAISAVPTDPTLSNLKEKMTALVPGYIEEVARYDDTLEDLPTRQTYTSTERHIKISAEVLADRSVIGLERARQTLKATTHRGTRSTFLPISRRYRADHQFGVKRLNGKFATDMIWAKSRMLRSNVASQIYSHKCGFNTSYHLQSAKGDNVGYTLSEFVSDYGAPEHLTYNGASVQVGQNTYSRTPLGRMISNIMSLLLKGRMRIQQKEILGRLRRNGIEFKRRPMHRTACGNMISRTCVRPEI
jgi:hypothetical protein